MTTTFTPWEAVELELVAQTYGDPAWTVKRIAEKLERTVTEIYAAAKLLGVQRPKRRLDHARIAELKSQGLSDDAIANLLGCSKGGVQGALRSMNEKQHSEKRKQRELREKTNKPWQPKEKQFLADHYSKPNWDCHRIAVALRRSEASVYRKAFDLGLKKGESGMNIIKQAYDRMTGVLGYDYQGKPLRKGDAVYPRFPGMTKPAFRFGMEVISKTPSHARNNGEVQVLAGDGSIAQAWSEQIKKEPPLNDKASWEQMEDITGWTPTEQEREVEHG